MRSRTVVAVVAGTLATTAIAPTIKLKRDEVEAAVPSAELMALLRQRFTEHGGSTTVAHTGEFRLRAESGAPFWQWGQ